MAEIQCSDCYQTYDASQPHEMFCPAKTCTLCGTTYGEVLSIVENGEIDDDGFPERHCEECGSDDPEDE